MAKKGVTRISGIIGTITTTVIITTRRQTKRDNGLVVGSATGSNGPTGRLRDAGHRVVVGSLGVERQENGSVVIRIEHSLDGPPRELDDLEKRSRT